MYLNPVADSTEEVATTLGLDKILSNQISACARV